MPRIRGMSITSVDNSGTVTGHQIEFNSLTWGESKCTKERDLNEGHD